MDSIIREWVGKQVSVTLKAGGIATPVTVEGKLINVGEPGALLESPKGRTFVPVASIQYINLLNTN